MTVLSDPESSQKEKEQVKNELKRNDFSDTIDLLAYCLMPNHYHFLVKVKEGRALEKFMKSLMTRYAKYFNTRYDRVGPLFQGRYKAVLVENDEQLLYLTRYIHRNPISQKTPKQQGQGQSLLWEKVILTQPTSYPVYVKKFEQSWVKPGDILGNFAKSGFNSYESFVADQDFHVMDMETYFLEYLQ